MSRRSAAPILKAVSALALSLALAPWSHAQQPDPAQEAQPPVHNDESLPFGKKVASIDVRLGPVPLAADRRDHILALLPLQPGATLTRSLLHDCMQVLYDTQLFDQLDSNTEITSDGEIKLVFDGTPNYFYSSVEASDESNPPSAGQLINVTKIALGTRFSPETNEAAVANLKSLLEQNGYYRAQVKPEFTFDQEHQAVHAFFRIERGVPAQVGEVSVADGGMTSAEVSEIAHLHTGDTVTASRITKALDRLHKYFRKQQRLEARAAIDSFTYRPETNRLDLHVRIQTGPKDEVRVEGASLRSGAIKRLVPFFEEGTIDEDLINEGKRNLRDHFQTQGYFEADVQAHQDMDPAGQKRTVVYEVDKGSRHRVMSLVITGNHYFDTATIRERMQIQTASLLQFRGRFSQSMLTSDRERVRLLYLTNGFRAVKVDGQVDSGFDGDSEHLRVRLTIEEGIQSKVASVDFSGNISRKNDDLLALIASNPGQPFSESNLASDRDSILNDYLNEGYRDVRCDPSAESLPEDPTRFKVHFVISEGDRQIVRGITVSGLVHTRPKIVDRELDIKPGDPLSLLDILAMQRRMYDLDIFSDIKVAVQNQPGSLPDKDLIIQFTEAKRYTFGYGFGFEVQTGDPQSRCISGGATICRPEGRTGVSPRVSFDVTRINFLGLNHTISLKARVGRLQQRALFTYEAPRFFDNPKLKLSFTAFFDKTQDVRTFTAERLEGAAQVVQRLGRANTIQYRIAFRRVQVDEKTLQVDPAQIPLLSQPVRIAIPSITFVRDTRDDPIDSHRGFYNTADFGVASGKLGSESSFVRLFFQNSSYHSFGVRRWVFARTTRFGIEEPYGGASQSFVPLPERYYAGGSSSHRGFAINQAGPRDQVTGFPVGGNALFLNIFELRTPSVALPFLESGVSAVLFHDMGNVYTSVEEMVKGLGRASQRNITRCRDLSSAGQCDFTYTSHSIGAGLRYKTPIGPVRFDLGYNLNPTRYAIRNGVPAFRTTSRINFFFSIGQTF